MISYCWAQQPMVKRISAVLQAAGYNIWLDIEQMAGSTLEAMASAVEGSIVVLVGVSRRYKESPNCRLEGEYTSNLKKDFIPLMMENDYRPDGWLGIMLGSKLWYDFRSDASFDSAMDQVIKVLGNRGKQGAAGTQPQLTTPVPAAGPSTTSAAPAAAAAAPAPVPVPAPAPAAAPAFVLSGVLLWKFEDVKKWLEKIGVPEYAPAFEAGKIEGEALVELSNIKSHKVVLGLLRELAEKLPHPPTIPIGQQLKLIFHLSKLPHN